MPRNVDDDDVINDGDDDDGDDNDRDDAHDNVGDDVMMKQMDVNADVEP